MNWILHYRASDDKSFGRFSERAENLGFNMMLLGESQLFYADIYISMVLAALNTSRMKIGPGVTNLKTRDLTVTARGMISLNKISGGRAVLGLGSGDTALARIGQKGSAVSEVERGVKILKSLVSGEVTLYNGLDVKMGDGRHSPIPIYLSAEGPRMLELAARVADGIIVGSGITKDVLTWTQAHLQKGFTARRAHRPDIVLALACCIDEDREKAGRLVRLRLANRARHALAASIESVPMKHLPEVKTLLENFNVFGSVDNPRNTRLISDYIVNRFCVYGTPEDCVSKFKEIKEMGVSSVMLDFRRDIISEQMELFAKRVLPKVE